MTTCGERAHEINIGKSSQNLPNADQTLMITLRSQPSSAPANNATTILVNPMQTSSTVDGVTANTFFTNTAWVFTKVLQQLDVEFAKRDLGFSHVDS